MIDAGIRNLPSSMRRRCPLMMSAKALCFAAVMAVRADPTPPASLPAPDASLDLAAGLTVNVHPGRVYASPGALSDAFSVTITNTTPHHTPVSVKVESLAGSGWQGTPARLDDVAPGGSVMLAMYIRAPGLAAAPFDNILVTALAEFDGKTRGQASFIAARRPCLVDWNGYGGLNELDLQQFLDDILRRNADFDGDGVTSLADLFQFLDLFFLGCSASPPPVP